MRDSLTDFSSFRKSQLTGSRLLNWSWGTMTMLASSATKITVFTRNQPRHLALVNRLAKISEQTHAILECNTVFPGKVSDFYRDSDVMREYFEHVISAENRLFGNVAFTAANVNSLSLKCGDLNLLNEEQLHEALNADIYVVFGSS